MTLIFNRNIQGPATYAIIIGVGEYSNLGEEGFEEYDDMEQLTSPPLSAREFTRWFLEEYHYPDKPLAYVETLVSDAKTQNFKVSSRKTVSLKKANKKNVKKSILNWVKRGESNKDNRLIFFFCGHGMTKGYETVLLLEDFGVSSYAPLDNAIDFGRFHLGMDKCKAREQCYFIDACRTVPNILLTTYNYVGDPIISPSTYDSSFGSRYAPIYYSTLRGESAYAREDQPSIFTSALIKSLNGAGSEKKGKKWELLTDRVNFGITRYLKWNRELDNSLPQQSVATDNLSSFVFHSYKNNPQIPVLIGCRPKSANSKADLSYKNDSDDVQRSIKQSEDWGVDIQTGKCEFRAEFPNNDYRNKESVEYVNPPCLTVELEVKLN